MNNLEILKQQTLEMLERETDPAKIAMTANILLSLETKGELPPDMDDYITSLRHRAWEKLNHKEHEYINGC